MFTVRQVPDPVLRKKALPVKEGSNGKELDLLVQRLYQTMEQEKGIGLAAPQVGISLRVIVLDVPLEEEGKSFRRAMINPSFQPLSQETVVCEEGCLSVPDFYGEVARTNRILVSYENTAGKVVMEEVSGLVSVCVQHEIDHLDGVIFLDRLLNQKDRARAREALPSA